MSKQQPFCDSSHFGTSFKPIKFSLDESVKAMFMCGCKISSSAPFCDGVTCKKLQSGEGIEPIEAAQSLVEEVAELEEPLENFKEESTTEQPQEK